MIVSEYATMRSSVIDPVVSVFDELVLKFDQALLGLPPIRSVVFEGRSGRREDLSACRLEFLVKQLSHAAGVKWVAHDDDLL